MADEERRLNEMPGRLPPGHVERRQVSNEVLAYQIQSLHDTVIANQALLREQMKDGFADVNKRLDRHDQLIAGVREEMVRIDARTASLEAHRNELDLRIAEETRQNVLELATARDGATNDRITTFITRAAMGSLGVLVMVVGLVQAFGGFK